MVEILGAPGAPNVWLDALDYAGRVILARRDPFANAGELAWASREVQSLVRADFVALPLATLLRSRGIGARASAERPVRALRTFLALPALREALGSAARVLAEQARMTRGLVVSTPSPGRLLRAFDATAALDEDDVDAAAVALADFLRGLAEHEVLALRVDSDADELAHVHLHTPITNVAAHFGWWTLFAPQAAPQGESTLARAAGYAADSRDPEIVWLEPGLWRIGGAAVPELSAVRLCVGRLPADAEPERVISQRALLRAPGA